MGQQSVGKREINYISSLQANVAWFRYQRSLSLMATKHYKMMCKWIGHLHREMSDRKTILHIQAFFLKAELQRIREHEHLASIEETNIHPSVSICPMIFHVYGSTPWRDKNRGTKSMRASFFFSFLGTKIRISDSEIRKFGRCIQQRLWHISIFPGSTLGPPFRAVLGTVPMTSLTKETIPQFGRK